jgi:alpha-1,3-mannosyltransferase
MALNEAPTPPTASATRLVGSHSPDRAVNVIRKFYFRNWSLILLCLEFLLDVYFLWHGPLHPIDYPTYLVQARQVRLGERDYAKIYGPTGPLVYPGGHVIIFAFFEKLFGIKGDTNWRGYLPAQWIYLALQLAHTYVCISVHCIADRFKR